MSTRSKRSVKVKEENEIQTYINSFKEMEEQEDDPGKSDDKKPYETEELEDEYEEVLVGGEDQANDDDYKYVFIVQDEEDATAHTDADGEVYEFDDDMQEEALDEVNELPKISKVVGSSTNKKPTGQNIPSLGNGHMCSFCNYTTPKRYLLARHMKCHSEDR